MRRYYPLVAASSELLAGRRTRSHESVHAHPFAKLDAKVGLEQCLVLLPTRYLPFLTPSCGRRNQTVVGQRNTPVWCRQ
jgi:hypothetical protein